jgi:hypothetical protein
MTAGKIVSSIVDSSVVRIIREHYSDPDTGVEVLLRYHPNITPKEALTALCKVDAPALYAVLAEEMDELCTKPGGADLKGLFEFISHYSDYATELPPDEFWDILEMTVPPDQVAWLRRQLEVAFARQQAHEPEPEPEPMLW